MEKDNAQDSSKQVFVAPARNMGKTRTWSYIAPAHIASDKAFLEWMHSRLVNKCGEKENYDYMLRFQAIIDKIPADQYSPVITHKRDDVIKTYSVS